VIYVVKILRIRDPNTRLSDLVSIEFFLQFSDLNVCSFYFSFRDNSSSVSDFIFIDVDMLTSIDQYFISLCYFF